MSELSYLEKLLDGVEVEWSNLGNLCDIFTGGEAPQNHIKGDTPTSDYQYPIYGNGAEIYGYADSYRIGQDAVTISSIGANTGTIYFRKAFFTPIIRLKVVIPKHSWLLPRYLFHYLSSQTINSKSSSVPNMNASDVKKLSIPIPCPNNPEKSLAIQSEIVRILDTFTALTAELTAELTARKKQYNFYRDQLLSFKEGEVEWRTLGEIAQYSKTRISFEQLDETNYVGVDNLLQNRAGKTSSNHVPTLGKLTEFRLNDILIGNIRPYLKKIWQSDCVGGTSGDVLAIRCIHSSINPSYLYHVLADDKFFEYNMQHAKGAKMPRGSKEDIMKYPIPIPDQAEQARIINILDKFDALTNSISEGLPREIALRQQQYEYYRDLLFSFPKPADVAN
jgi:type I restriction enzyme S subunit